MPGVFLRIDEIRKVRRSSSPLLPRGSLQGAGETKKCDGSKRRGRRELDASRPNFRFSFLAPPSSRSLACDSLPPSTVLWSYSSRLVRPAAVVVFVSHRLSSASVPALLAPSSPLSRPGPAPPYLARPTQKRKEKNHEPSKHNRGERTVRTRSPERECPF